MLYTALEPETAVAETVQKPAPYTLAEFRLKQDVTVVDFSLLPPRQSLVSGLLAVEDHKETANRRHAINFLHCLVDDLSKPVVKDGCTHAEYVPTQIVTEYFRYLYAIEVDSERSIGGMVYPSVRFPQGGKNTVLFAEPVVRGPLCQHR